MFTRKKPGVPVEICIDDVACIASEGDSVAAALLASGNPMHRLSVVSGAPRAPYCMMGVCFECLVEIDGRPYRQACLIPVASGMRIRRQRIVQDEVWY